MICCVYNDDHEGDDSSDDEEISKSDSSVMSFGPVAICWEESDAALQHLSCMAASQLSFHLLL